MTPNDLSPGWRFWWLGALLALCLFGVGVARMWPRTLAAPVPTFEASLEHAAAALRREAPELFADFDLSRPAVISVGAAADDARFLEGLRWVRRQGPRDVRAILTIRWALANGRFHDACTAFHDTVHRGGGNAALVELSRLLTPGC